MLFIGKGGVGKTTVACASALAYARAGERVLIASIDQAHSLGDVFGIRIVHDAGTVTGIQSVTDRVDAIEIDSLALLEDRFRDLVSSFPMGTGHNHDVGLGELDPAELTGLPGAQELLALAEINDYVHENTWDTIVVDCGPSADLLRTLAAPDMLLGYLNRLWPQTKRVGALLGGDPRMMVLAAVVERISGGVASIGAMLADRRRTSAYLVTGAERVAVAEAARTRSGASLLGLRLSAVIVNKVLPPLGDVVGKRRRLVRPRAEEPAAQWYHDRRAEQLAVVAELRTAMSDIRTVLVHHAGREPVGVDAVGALTSIAELDRPDPTLPAQPYAAAVATDTNGYALRMPMPLVDPATLRLGRAGDDLIVGVDGVRRRVSLTPDLRRMTVAGAELDGHDLIVRFCPETEE